MPPIQIGLGLGLANTPVFAESYDPDAVDFFASATGDPVTDPDKKQQINEFIIGLKDLGLWDQFAFYGFRSGMGAGYPMGPAGYSGSTYAGNRNSTRWTPTGASFAAGGLTMTYNVGGAQTQYIAASYNVFASGNNPMVGSAFRMTEAFPASETPGSFPNTNDAGAFVTDQSGVPLIGLNTSAPVASLGNRSRIYIPCARQSNGYMNSAADGGGSSQWTAMSSTKSATLGMSFNSIGEKKVHLVCNAIADFNDDTVFTMAAYSTTGVRWVAPVYTGSNTHNAVVYGAVMFYGTKAEIAALPLKEVHPLMAATILSDVVVNVCSLLNGQSNAVPETAAAANAGPGGIVDITNVTINQTTVSYGGEPISHWLIASTSGDRQTDSDTAYNSPVAGYRLLSSQSAFSANLPAYELSLERSVKELRWNQGEQDTEYRYEAMRYGTNLTRVVAYFRATYGDDMRVIYHLIDYDPPARTDVANGFTLSGLTGAAAGANGAYAITAASGEADYDVAYVWTKGTYVLQIASGAWELRNSGTLVMSGSATNAAHPELVSSWTMAVGGGAPVFPETRLGNIERVRQAIRDVAAADSLGYTIETRHFPRTGSGDNVHWYNVDAALPLYAAAMKAVYQTPGFLP